MWRCARFELLFWIAFVFQTLEQQLAGLKTEMEQLRQEKLSEELSSSAAQLQELQELQAQLVTYTLLDTRASPEIFTDDSKNVLISPVG